MPRRASAPLAALLLLAACANVGPAGNEELPRGIAPGDQAPMTDREATREAADREAHVGAAHAPQPRGEGSVAIPPGSSARSDKWQPREGDTDGAEGEGVEGEGVDTEGGEGEGEGEGEIPVVPSAAEVGGGGPADRP